jgi:hypothetical protein
LWCSSFLEKKKTEGNLPVWIYVCFFISDFWWKRLPQCTHEYGRVSECINKCVDNVDERLKHFPHVLHWKQRSWVWVVRCWVRDNEWPNVFGHKSHEYGFKSDECVRLTWTSKPWEVEKYFSQSSHLYESLSSVSSSSSSSVFSDLSLVPDDDKFKTDGENKFV